MPDYAEQPVCHNEEDEGDMLFKTDRLALDNQIKNQL